MEKKKCCDCGEDKPDTRNFPRDVGNRLEYDTVCVECIVKRQQAREKK